MKVLQNCLIHFSHVQSSGEHNLFASENNSELPGSQLQLFDERTYSENLAVVSRRSQNSFIRLDHPYFSNPLTYKII